MARQGALIVNKSDGLIGEYKDFSGITVLPGWLWCDGRTIGNAASGATARANSDTKRLFIHLWENFSNTELDVSGGRGASAEADFNADKTISLPDLRGRVLVGKDDMGGSPSNRITSAASGINGAINGAAGGAQTHTITTAQMPSHTHTQPNHTHSIPRGNTNNNGASPHFPNAQFSGSQSSPSTYDTGNPSNLTINNTGSGNPHQNTQPSYICSKLIKYL